MGLNRTQIISVILLALICGLLFTYRLGVRGLAEPDEGRYAEVAREMSVTGDWLVPRFNGVAHLHKPPLSYWFISASFRIFGVSEFSSRLPSAISAVITVLAVYYIGFLLRGHLAGFIAGIVLVTAPQFMASATLAFPDMFLTCFVTVSMAFAIRTYFEEAKSWRILLFWVFAGLGMLTKGPVVLVILLAPLLFYALIFREWRYLGKMRFFSGLILFLIISLPWYIFAVLRFPGLLEHFLTEQTVERLTSDFRPQPRYVLPATIMALSFPWVAYFITGTVTAFRERNNNDKSSGIIPLILIWFLVVIVFFTSLRSSIISYILPAYPPLAVITGLFLSEKSGRKNIRSVFAVPAVITILLSLSLGIIAIWYAGSMDETERYIVFRGVIRSLGIAGFAVSIAGTISLIVKRPAVIIAAQAAFFTSVFVSFLHYVPMIEKESHWRVKGKYLAEMINERRSETDKVVMAGQIYWNLPFYLGETVLHFGEGLENRFEEPGVYRRYVLPQENFEGLINSGKRIFIVSSKDYHRFLDNLFPDRFHILGAVQEHVLLSNMPDK